MITSRQEFAEYCLRALGAPVVEVNVQDDQLEDRIDEALEYWRLYHPEGIEKVFLKHKVTATTMQVAGTVDDTPTGSVLINDRSGAAVYVLDKVADIADPHIIHVRGWNEGEWVTGDTFHLQSDPSVTGLIDGPVVPGTLDLKYMEVADSVYGVTRVLPITGGASSRQLFDVQYQLRLHDLYDLTSTSVIYYKQVMSHLSLLDMELNGKPQMRFNRYQNRVYIDINWDQTINPGDYLVVEAYRALDPEDFYRLWNNAWLKHYGTALIKRQWGTNLKKFNGIALAGGVQLDGQGLYQEAMTEIDKLEEELLTKQAPLAFFMG